MSPDWRSVALGDVASIGAGNAAPQVGTLYVDDGAPFFRTSDVGRVRFGVIHDSRDHLSDAGAVGLRRLPKGTILFPKSGASTFLNHRVTLGVDGYVSSHLATIVADDSLADSRFLLYFLATVSAQDLIQGQSYPSLNLPMIAGIRVPLPCLAEQQRIVAILDEAFEGVAIAKVNAEKNLENVRALCVNHVESIFNEGASGWAHRPLGDVCEFVRGPFGGSLKKATFVPDGYAVYEQQHAIYDRFDQVRYFVDEDKFVEMKRFELHPGDLIMSCSGTMGRVAIVPVSVRRGIINQALLKLTPKAQIRGAFLKEWMESAAFQSALQEYSGGAAIQNVASVKVLKEIRTPIPAVDEQDLLVKEIGVFRRESDQLVSVYQHKLDALDALKKSLLNEAFAGNQ